MASAKLPRRSRSSSSVALAAVAQGLVPARLHLLPGLGQRGLLLFQAILQLPGRGA